MSLMLNKTHNFQCDSVVSIGCTRSGSVKSYENKTLVNEMQIVYFESIF